MPCSSPLDECTASLRIARVSRYEDGSPPASSWADQVGTSCTRTDDPDPAVASFSDPPQGMVADASPRAGSAAASASAPQIARALVLEPRELPLDEPTKHLDVQNQFGLLEPSDCLPVTTVIALHGRNLVAMWVRAEAADGDGRGRSSASCAAPPSRPHRRRDRHGPPVR
ncbi:hypothetical protein [Streptomyces sp. NPDC016845]|uniref:hypothetical protein n=1 Tax=Streptomyces sp. NPDC016845 TaxID=3364972 RepID=UPI0037A9FDA1